MVRLLCFVLVLGLFGCSGQEQTKPAQEKPSEKVEKKIEEKKEEEKVIVKDMKEDEAQLKIKAFEIKITAQNEKLEKSSIEHFKLGSSEIPKKQWDQWAKKAAPIVRDLIKIMPEGYVLEIYGHSDSTGNDSVNEKLSENRALTVYQALLKQGIKAEKLSYKGLAATALISSVKDTDSRQRRVSFKVVKK